MFRINYFARKMLNYTEVKTGDELVFARQPSWHWFTNVIEDSKLLEIGKIYRVLACEPASSWTCIKLEGFPDVKHGDKMFCLSSFEKPTKDAV